MPIVALIQEETCLLASDEIDAISDGVDCYLKVHGKLTRGHSFYEVQSFQTAGLGVMAEYQGTGSEDVGNPFLQQRLKETHSQRVDLIDEHIPVLVQHEPRETVGLTKHDAVALGAGIEGFAPEACRFLDPLSEERVGRFFARATHQSDSDEGARIHIADAQGSLPAGEDLDPAPGLIVAQGRRNLVAENPAVPGQHAALTACVEPDGGRVVARVHAASVLKNEKSARFKGAPIPVTLRDQLPRIDRMDSRRI